MTSPEQRFRSLLDGTPVLLFLADSSGQLEFMNAELRRYAGVPDGIQREFAWFELLRAEDHPAAREAMAEALRGAPTGRARIELTARTMNAVQEVRWVKVMLTRQLDERGAIAGWIGSLVDINDQIVSEAAMRDAEARKTEFLGMLGHELRNPLAAIRNAAAVLERVPSDDLRVRWVHDLLERQVEHVMQLVDDLLDISRVSRGALRLHLAPVELRQILEHAVEMVQPMLHRRAQQMSVSFGATPIWVQGDSVRLAQLFENLLTNASKYTDDGGTVALALEAHDGRARVSVRDNGIGIEPQMLGRVFDLFVQDDRSINRSHGGLGTGLSLARHLVELHDGTIEARSGGAGQGSEFIVTLPALPASLAQPEQLATAGRSPAGGRILIVDDDVDAGESLVLLLRLCGYDTEFASGVDQALAVAERFRPRAVLLDLAMPDADGYEVAARLRQMPGWNPLPIFIAISGYARPSDVQRTAAEGFAKHLVKPVNATELDALLRELLVGQEPA